VDRDRQRPAPAGARAVRPGDRHGGRPSEALTSIDVPSAQSRRSGRRPPTDASTVEIEAIDQSGHVRKGPAVRTNGLRVVATGWAQGRVHRTASAQRLRLRDRDAPARRAGAESEQAALSPDGRQPRVGSARIPAPAPRTACSRCESARKTIHQLDDAGERLMVADGERCSSPHGANVRQGRVDTDGSTAVYGLAPAPPALLALG